MLRSSVLKVLALAGLMVLSACARTSGDTDADPGPPSPPPTSVPAEDTGPSASVPPPSGSGDRPDEAPSGGIDPLAGASTADVSVPASNTETALLRAVRSARHEGYDRVVFEFANALPGYRIGYTQRPVLADGSGDEVAVDGAAVVEVAFENALDADLSVEPIVRTYTGPSRIRPATPEVVELVALGGFEAQLRWAIGVRDRVDFRVSTLSGPPRVVIDLRNH
ncbi:MAG: AMIN-like domain-containing (lipo)protein [Acidimicrobiales bacterium]